MRVHRRAVALVAAAAMTVGTATAQQSFGEAEGMGGQFGQQPWLQPNMPAQGGQWGVPAPDGQYQQQPGSQQPDGQFGVQRPGGQFQQPGMPPQGGQFGMQPPGGQFQQPGMPPQGGQFGMQQPGGQFQQPGMPPQGGQFGVQQPGGQFQQPGTPPQGGQFGMQPPGGQFQQPGGQGQPPGGGLPPQMIQALDQLAQFERRDFGVPPTDQLHQGAMHGATPSSIPGGQVITTRGLFELVQGRQTPYMIFDVLGGGEMLPGAIPAVQASSPGSFDDQISQQMGNYLRQATGGNTQVPLIFYCASVECWMSYNAALRAIKLGYSNVLWYRGGIAAWKYAGGPTMQAGGFQGGGQQGGYQGGGGQQGGYQNGGQPQGQGQWMPGQ